MKKKKIIIISLIVISIIIIISVILVLNLSKKDKVIEKPTNVVEVVEKIDKFGYQLEDRDTKIYIEKFNKLKEVLNKEEIDYKEYASLLTELFLIDLYTLDNKVSKYDIGSLDFIYETEIDKFKNKLLDTMYKLVLDNSYHDRKQELPVVKEVQIIKIEETKYKKGDISLNAYKVKASIKYEKDLGYDKEAIVTLVKEENKLFVVNLNK